MVYPAVTETVVTGDVGEVPVVFRARDRTTEDMGTSQFRNTWSGFMVKMSCFLQRLAIFVPSEVDLGRRERISLCVSLTPAGGARSGFSAW